MKPGLLALSLFKPSDGTTYQLDGANVSPESQGYLKTAQTVGAIKGNVRKKGDIHSFIIKHDDATFHGNLTGDADADNRAWQLVWAEFGAFGLWYETSYVIVSEEKVEIDPESQDPYPYTIELRASGANLAIARGENLLYAHARTQGQASVWQDSNSNNIPDGYAQSGGTPVFSGDTLSLSGSSGSADIRKVPSSSNEIIFPISGIELTLSISVTQLHANAASQGTALSYWNFAGSQLASDINTITQTGRGSGSATTPSNIYSVGLFVADINTISGAGTLIVSDPAVLLNADTGYIDG